MDEYNLQKKLKIVENAIGKIDEIVFHYLKEHGPIYKWEPITKSIFSLNCDTELISYLQENNIEINKELLENGVTFGLLVIMREIEEYFHKEYGEFLDLYHKENMYKNINLASYNYLTTGFEEINGN